MDSGDFLQMVAAAVFFIGFAGIVARRNLMIVLMGVEMMLNGVILMLVVAAVRTATLEGPVLAFMIFVVAACELAVAIPIVLLLMKRRNTLDLASYDDLKG
jgi:NADH-quinone oxidoreductase subunit K